MKQLFPRLILSSILIVPLYGVEHVATKKKKINAATPLHTAVWQQNITLIQQLIENGADCNAKNNHGNTPLHISLLTLHTLSYLDLSIAQMLIAAGARLYIKNYVNDEYPLETLVYKIKNMCVQKYRKLVKILLLAGIQDFRWMDLFFNSLFSQKRPINYQDDDLKATRIMYAAAQGRFEMVKIRLRYKTNIFLEDAYKRTVFDIVKIILGNKDDLKLTKEKEDLYKEILKSCYRYAAKDTWFVFRIPGKGAPTLPLDIVKYIVLFMTRISHAQFLQLSIAVHKKP